MRGKVSVVIPSYNHGNYIAGAIRSILAQTYPGWETVIVDDGSTDETEHIVAEFIDPRIIYLKQKNKGLAAARNAGIRATDGEFLAFLDADDEWEPDFLQCCLDELRQDEALAGVYTRTRFIDLTGNLLPQVGGQALPSHAFKQRILEEGFFPPHAALIRRHVLQKIGLFDTQLTSVEDWDIWIRISRCYEMRGIPRPLVRYRVSPHSMSTNVARMHENRLCVLAKNFGPLDGDPTTWAEAKRRAYGFAYRSTAFGYIEQGRSEEGWQYLQQGARIWPPLLDRVDTFYEIACGDAPKGRRGVAEFLNVEKNGSEMLKHLDELFAAGNPSVGPLRRTTYGNAYLAIGMLSDQAGKWATARHYLYRAVKANPRLMLSASFVRRWVKLHAGQRLVNALRQVRTA
jgi:tetratricopeptide (TPR) repeat protein